MRVLQFLIKLQAKQPSSVGRTSWPPPEKRTKQAEGGRGKAWIAGVPRSMVLAEQRSRAALKELEKLSNQPLPPAAEMWIAWRKWKAFLQFQNGIQAAEKLTPPQRLRTACKPRRSLEAELVRGWRDRWLKHRTQHGHTSSPGSVGPTSLFRRGWLLG